MLTKNYELEKGALPLPWDEYSRQVETAWHDLLNSDEGKAEAGIQAFLETHPCLVPGGQSMSGPSGHSAYPAALITQPRLPGFNARVPDFMWIATDSGTTYAVVVEIEAPTKRWFRKDGTPSADLTQAQSQLTDWRIWFEKTHNQQAFLEHYCGPAYLHRRTFLPRYVLIFGRRSEFDGRDDLASKRPRLQRANEYYMTFDRLHPIKDHDQYMTVRSNGRGYEAVSIPATFKLGPSLSHHRSVIAGKGDVVDKSPFMSAERKAFLKRRMAYWDEKRETVGKLKIYNTGDWE